MRLEDLQGRRLGRYEIRALLGRGGMAAVYRAHDTVLRRDVALKVLYPQYTNDGTLIERFQREAVLAAQLDHPNIVPIYDVGEADGLVYIAMKLLSGRSLDDVLRIRVKLPIGELVPVVEQIAAALDYAHARGIVHRDIKAGNILLEGTGDGQGPAGARSADAYRLSPGTRALLTDFGIAKSLDAPGMTGTGVLLGTPDYMAPEQIRGAQVVDGRADIYALGVLVFRCLTGRRPFDGGTDEVLLGHLHGQVAAPSLIEPSLPATVDPVIHKAMARHPADRYGTAGAFARALAAVAGVEQPTPPPARSRGVEERVVVPRVAVDGLARGRVGVGDEATRRGVAAPPIERAMPAVAVPPSLQRSRPGGSGAGALMLALLLVLLVGGGGLLLAQGLLRRDDGAGALAAVTTPTPSATERPAPTEAPAPATSPAEAPAPGTPPTGPTQATATAQPTTTPSPHPTATASPTSTPSPQTTTTPTPTPCPVSAVSGFGKLWNENATVQQRLDCPIEAEQPGQIAEQPFERGSMFWFQPQERIYALIGVNSGTWRAFEQSSLPVGPTPEPPQPPTPGLVAPISGFGLVWNTFPEVRDALGWGTAHEAGPYGGAFQPFENGSMLFSPTGLERGKTIYVLYKDGTFARYDDTYVDPKR